MTRTSSNRSGSEKAADIRAQATREYARRRALAVGMGVATTVLLLVGVGIVVQATQQESLDTSLDKTPPAHQVNGAFVVGKANAPVTITNYSDYICPFCGMAHRDNKGQIDRWVNEETVKVEYRMISFLDQASTDEYSTRALNMVAAVVNTTPEAFPKVHDALFAEQPAEGGAGLPDDRLIEIAVTAGAPEVEIRRAVQDRSFEGWIRAVTEQASKNGIRATPTVLVNGKEIKNAGDPGQLSAAVEKALARS